jgi:hypothetical protein
MLRRLKAIFNFDNFCRGCELYYEMLIALGLTVRTDEYHQ